MRKLVRTENGFSLIELMVVVGIIGILAAIAVPQFSKFQAKARQTEAKTGLAGLYTAEKGFFTEYTGYTTDLRNAGFGVEGTRLRYDVGFPNLAACSTLATGAPVEVGTNNLASGASSITFAFGAAPTAIAAGTAVCDSTAATFTGVAYGNPNSASAGNNNGDVWTVNQIKSVVNSTPGIL